MRAVYCRAQRHRLDQSRQSGRPGPLPHFRCGPNRAGPHLLLRAGVVGLGRIRSDGKLHAKSLVPPDPPTWTQTTTFDNIIVTTEGIYFASRGGVAFRDFATQQCQLFEMPQMAAAPGRRGQGVCLVVRPGPALHRREGAQPPLGGGHRTGSTRRHLLREAG